RTPRARRRWPIVLTALAALVTSVVLARFIRGRTPLVEVVQATVPTDAGGVPVLSGAGYVVSADRYIAIGVRVAGRIDRYMVEEGDHVKAGDPLVQLDAREYQAAVERADANLKLARANANLAEQQLRRMEALG